MNSITSRRHSMIGVDRLVKLEWLEKTATMMIAGNDTETIKSSLQKKLVDSFRSSNPNVRGSIDKTITILMKIWVNPPIELKAFHKTGVELLRIVADQDHIPIHWGMVMAVYPFWSKVAAHVGRLISLQGSVSATHIQRRIREQYGQRETVSRRARYVIRSYMDWGVLKESGAKGIYNLESSIPITKLRMIGYLVEAYLQARENGSAPIRDVINSPELFPFQLETINTGKLETASSNIEIVRHGLDDTLVILRK